MIGMTESTALLVTIARERANELRKEARSCRKSADSWEAEGRWGSRVRLERHVAAIKDEAAQRIEEAIETTEIG